MMRTFLLCALFLVALFLPAKLCGQNPNWTSHFDYDRSASLNLKTVGNERREGANIYDITYASPKGGVVPAYLVVPAKGKGPFAGIVWGHWYWENSPMRNRKEFLDEAIALADAGVVSLLTDGPIARPGHAVSTEPLNEQQTIDLVQAVVDMRRGVDLLLERADVDPKRLAYVGHSYNAMVGGILSGVDRRPKAYVLMAGPMSDEVDLKSKEYQEYRQKVGPEKFDAFIAKYAWLDEGKYVSHAAPAFVFLQYASQEKFLTPERAREYEKVVSDPKRLEIYDAPHALNAKARQDRVRFIIEQLKLKPLSPARIARIPDLEQPPDPN
ncbi:MAG: alpha/beta hydrolase family protein [Pyrinomonadaceae bacterium]